MFHDASGVVLCALTFCQVAPGLDCPTFKMPFLFCEEFLKKLIKKKALSTFSILQKMIIFGGRCGWYPESTVMIFQEVSSLCLFIQMCCV